MREQLHAERTLRLTVAYDGTDFHGWQEQPGLRTVAGELRAALERVLRHPVALQGASRTDAGVHARGQVASLRTRSRLPCERLLGALWAALPPDLAVCDLVEAPPDFDARFSARAKHYRYRILCGRAPDPLERRTSWHVRGALDVERLRQAAALLVGTHDFRGFARASDRRPSVRTLYRFAVEEHGRIIVLDVEGDGFLYTMVRAMAGTLVEVGLGRRPVECVREVLARRQRALAGPTAPPHGLCLERVFY
ncbi:MAG: tRNA pseudouridine synthase A [Planctomycetota bacterium]|nr:MAG: tRNA pseudouridine synthase A [Planctomycetota bacterium]